MKDNDYQVAYERERMARLAAEKLLDEKTRELSTSMSLIQSQFEELTARSILLDLQISISSFTQKQLSLTQALQKFISVLGEAESAPYVLVYLCNRATQSLRMIDIHWPPELPQEILERETGKKQPKDEVIAEKVVRKGKLICWSGDDQSTPARSGTFKSLDIDGCYAFPIHRFGEIIAVIEVGVRDWSKLHNSMIEHVESVSIQLTVALERRQAQKETEKHINSLKQALENLKETQEQLVHSEKMASLGVLAAGVAHEINNPVGFVMSNIDTLAEYTDVFSKLIKMYQPLAYSSSKNVSLREEILAYEKDENLSFILDDIKPMLSDAVNGMERVRDIVSNLKSFARADDSIQQEADINQCINNAIKLVWNEVKYDTKIDKRLGNIPKLICQPGQIEQVLINLIVNAHQACEKNGEIIITSEQVENEVLVSVTDNGCGIFSDELNKVFDPFYTTKPINEGTGLGLSISYGIIEKHGGRIKVKSEPGKGTTFKIFLPLTN